MFRQLLTSSLLLSTLILWGCQSGPELINKNYTPVSKDRLPGTSAWPGDSASVKRLHMHPLGPTGGWYSKRKTNLVDYARTMDLKSNFLTMRNSHIIGYVKVDKAGYLQARSYDDKYGNVYCGWAPDKIPLKATRDYVFVSLGTCSVGDGGLDQVHEVVWFPGGKKKGTILFTSAHPEEGRTDVSAADLYCKEFLGNKYWFNSSLAKDTINALLSQGKIEKAEEVISESLSVLSAMQDPVDGVTNQPIPAKKVNAGDWLLILSYKLGISAGEPQFQENLRDLNDLLQLSGEHAYHADVYRQMQPLYTWLDESLRAGKFITLEPEIIRVESPLFGHNPATISNYLNEPEKHQRFVRKSDSRSLFWAGTRAYLTGDLPAARKKLDEFLNSRFTDLDAFEIGAAAAIKAKLDKQ